MRYNVASIWAIAGANQPFFPKQEFSGRFY